MDIWGILGIAPTIDKKSIRRAYAAKTREIHPEERPEEFRQLHAAYQEALGYADFMSKIDWTEDVEPVPEQEPDREEQADQTRMQSPGPESELLSYFAENQEKHQQSVDAFLKYWKEFQSPYHNPEVLDWWKEYLASEEFQDIRYHPQVVHLLAEEINDKFFYGIDEVKVLFWDAYGFREDEENAYQGEQQKLWNCLYPAYAKQQNNVRNEKRQSKYEKILRILTGVVVAAVVLLCIMIPVSIRFKRENCRLYLIYYMSEQYPDEEFSEPELTEKLSDGDGVYTLYSLDHPELEITAKVECQYQEGEKTYLVTEDYCQLLLLYYAMQYGLETGQIIYKDGANIYTAEEKVYDVLLYPDIQQIDSFLEAVDIMFDEHEELQKISDVAVCAENVLYPEILIQGGVEHFPFSELQIYDLRNMDVAELAAAVREAYMIYMFQYESWNITSAQYREWGAEYEKICEQWVDDKGDWHEVYDPDTGEYLCRLFIPTYEYYDRYYNNTPMPTRMITVGSAYYFLIDREADLSVNEDGSGFTVEFYGDSRNFGEEPEEKFYELKNCY